MADIWYMRIMQVKLNYRYAPNCTNSNHKMKNLPTMGGGVPTPYPPPERRSLAVTHFQLVEKLGISGCLLSGLHLLHASVPTRTRTCTDRSCAFVTSLCSTCKHMRFVVSIAAVIPSVTAFSPLCTIFNKFFTRVG